MALTGIMPRARQAMPDFTPDGRPNFGKMMHEKRETISQLRDKGHPVDRRDKYEDGQPSRDQYSPKEERELLKRAVSVHRFADRIWAVSRFRSVASGIS